MRRALSAVGLGLCLLTALGFAHRHLWIAELTCHFRPFYALTLGSLATVYGLRGRWRAAGLFALLALVNLATIAPLYRRPVTPPANGPTLRLLHANLYIHNAEPERVLRLIAREKPDIVTLVELTPASTATLAPLQKTHPFTIQTPPRTRFGVGIWSRFPIQAAQARDLIGNDRPAVRATVARPDGGAFTVVAVHPPVPLTPAGMRQRDAQLRAAGDWLKEAKGAGALVGDFNATPWTHAMVDLGLRDSQPGFGIQGTWPAPLPLLLPLDHVLVTPDTAVRDRRVGPSIGSDHLPLIVELQLPA